MLSGLRLTRLPRRRPHERDAAHQLVAHRAGKRARDALSQRSCVIARSEALVLLLPALPLLALRPGSQAAVSRSASLTATTSSRTSSRTRWAATASLSCSARCVPTGQLAVRKVAGSSCADSEGDSVAQVHGSVSFIRSTQLSLGYAARARSIRVAPIVNIGPCALGRRAGARRVFVAKRALGSCRLERRQQARPGRRADQAAPGARSVRRHMTCTAFIRPHRRLPDGPS